MATLGRLLDRRRSGTDWAGFRFENWRARSGRSATATTSAAFERFVDAAARRHRQAGLGVIGIRQLVATAVCRSTGHCGVAASGLVSALGRAPATAGGAGFGWLDGQVREQGLEELRVLVVGPTAFVGEAEVESLVGGERE